VVCLLGGATALAGWRLLLGAAAALAAGAWGGAGLAPVLTPVSALAVDAGAMVLILGFALAMATQSFRQAQRLDAHRRALAERSAELERINRRMQRYLPRSLRDRVSRRPEEPCRWERRWLTVVFVDVAGFTELAELADAESLAAILDDYLAAMAEAAERCDGEVSKVLGDGVMVAFGMQDAERRAAVAAALEFCLALPDLLRRLAGRWRERGDLVELQTRAGVASGYCTLGDRGGAARLDFTLIGPPVNLASRLQVQAAVGGVLVDAATAALAPADGPLGPRRYLPIKGLGRTPVHGLVDPSAPSVMVPAPSEHPSRSDVPWTRSSSGPAAASPPPIHPSG
jgi:class 3 adenylate cyclase